MRRHQLDIGQRLQRLRSALGITQEEVARRSRVTAKFLSRIENGHASPTIDVLVRVVELGLETPIGAFFGGQEDGDDVAELRALLDRTTPAMRRRALRVLRALVD